MSPALTSIAGAEGFQEAVAGGARVLPAGGRTKPGLLCPSDGEVAMLDMTTLTGIVDYDPRELTLTVRAGTRVTELVQTLAEHEQFLPFDPPLASAGATIGGVVAAGASGPNAYRYGGVRDFVLGVTFIDGRGRLVSGGGQVVKNAAGFDFPKLMVGSMGRLGVLVQLTLKVFPAPRAHRTLRLELPSLEAALGLVSALGRLALPVAAIEVDPPGRVFVRLGTSDRELTTRVQGLAPGADCETCEGEAEETFWLRAAAMRWVPSGTELVRVPVTGPVVPALQARLAAAGAQARYSLGANVAWVAWPEIAGVQALDEILRSLGCAGQRLAASGGPALVGVRDGGAFATRLRAALDPDDRFPEL